MSDKPLDHRRALQLLAEAQVFAPAVVYKNTKGSNYGGYKVKDLKGKGINN